MSIVFPQSHLNSGKVYTLLAPSFFTVDRFFVLRLYSETWLQDLGPGHEKVIPSRRI